MTCRRSFAAATSLGVASGDEILRERISDMSGGEPSAPSAAI
jgi:hypothetical protein